jgi:cystathionine beta-lyase/cystathionine gamma-synthase
MTPTDHTRWTLDTQLVHSGLPRQRRTRPTSEGVPTAQPIFASTTYLHRDAAALDQAFEGHAPDAESTYVYARQGHANARTLEDTLAQAEGGVGAVAFGSGMAAIHAALLAAGLAPGARVLAAQDLFGVTLELLRKVFVPLGIEVVFRDLSGPAAADLIREDQPDVVFVETLSNPLVKVIDLPVIAAAAREIGAVSIVDSTFATPWLVRPIEHGCDLVVHSATKYLSGHGDSTGGIVVSARKTLLEQLRACATLVGATLSPFEAFLIARGLKTLALRMDRHCRNALQVARFLEQHPAVAAVHYPGLPSHPHHARAAHLLGHELHGGVLAFELKAQSRRTSVNFLDHLELCLPATTLGDVYSEVSYPPIASHRHVTEAERQRMGITEGCLRLSVGIEDVQDILADLDQALTHAAS